MGEITGRQVFGFTAGAFGIIIAVNLLLAYKAVTTFPGLEVSNSYVASQDFDRSRLAQEALGWTLTASYETAEKRLYLSFVDANGRPAPLAALSVLVGRTTEARDDQTPEMINASGLWTAPLDLTEGKWLLRVDAKAADGTAFSQRIGLFVKG
ncbi:MAG: FixH family protein [Rhodobacteraceae bacterium]|nr:FixH family protein [Paracoccaceae bacterium]MCF8513604.1 FixH family protein [Paracoccaceae bacterium]MCF8517496.1 FixH family protein [Paracoccaceae bacterium]